MTLVPRGGGRRRALHLVLAVSVSSLAAACNINPFSLGGDDLGGDDAGPIDGDTTGDGGGDLDGMSPDAIPPDACIAFPETCNEADDDCDGEIDEDFDLDGDPGHCGACGNRCAQPNAAGTCVSGECAYECQPGYVDTDSDTSNGCDYLCTPTNGGVEQCDVADNDCDTLIDEGVDLGTVDNCGGCGVRCFAINADPLCDAGTCSFGDCDPGFADVVPQIVGCEYACPRNPPIVGEECNGIDDDCDGTIDELPIAGLGDACTDAGFEAYGGVGRCTFGTTACSFGVPVCTGFVRPLANDAQCNGVDDDCDGDTDEDIDFTSDPLHCGSCDPCVLDNAIEGCAASACTVVACLPGFVDLDDEPGNGCEYACTPSGPETCDGRDNDCDGLVDLDDPDLTAPGNFCATRGACAGTTPTCAADPCTGQVGWTCAYGAGVETDTCGNLPLQEARCDDGDGDCDGRVDEGYPLKGTACADGGIGECRGEGVYECAPSQTALACEILFPGEAPVDETCDDRDNDCDGDVDEDAPDDLVEIAGPSGSFWIYTYEASRPDATAGGFGDAAHRSCSRPGVLPWRSVTYTEAAAACAAAGKRLCTEVEWQLACGGLDGFDYPYGNDYDPDACNGRDVDLDCAAPDSDAVAATGTAYGCPAPQTTACVSPDGAIDMSGNLREWTSTPVDGTAFRVRGGGYDNIAAGLRCDLSFIAFAPDLAFPNLGFRCCADQPEPTP